MPAVVARRVFMAPVSVGEVIIALLAVPMTALTLTARKCARRSFLQETTCCEQFYWLEKLNRVTRRDVVTRKHSVLRIGNHAMYRAHKDAVVTAR
jgi:hypothetical protein